MDDNNLFTERKKQPGRALKIGLLVAAVIALVACFVIAGTANVSPSSSLDDDASIHAYVDNQLIIFTDGSISRVQLEEYLAELGGEIYYEIEGVDIYYVVLDETYTHEELSDLCDQLETYDGIESALVDWSVTQEFSVDW